MAVMEATDLNYRELFQQDFVVVDFYGDHCGPCKALAPVFEKIATEMDFIHFVKLNVEKCPEAVMEYKVFGIPTLRFMKNGKLILETKGAKRIDQMRELIAKMLYSDL